MSRLFLLVAVIPVLASAQSSRQSAKPYVPPAGQWETRAPASLGLDAAWLDSAVAFHRAREIKNPRDMLQNHEQTFGREPYGNAVGPTIPRGDVSGVVIKGGYVVAQWGDLTAVEQTHSVTKSVLSAVVGLAVDRGLIRSVRDTVRPYVAPVLALNAPLQPGEAPRAGDLLDPFGSPHNRRITWDDLLRQTSDWEGTLWGKPEWADRPTGDPNTWRTRPRETPGAKFEYNDVRVNALALAALSVWRRPLPQIARDSLFALIGASPTWRWFGYSTSWVELDGAAVQSVSGGGHWGGGLFISGWDMARFGLLALRNGRWGDRQVLSEAWMNYSRTPTPANPGYGVMNWFLNGDGKQLPSAPRDAVVHLGNGTNLIYVDRANDLVVVARWIQNDAMDGLIGRVLKSLRDPAK